MPNPAIAAHARAGRLEAVRIGVRLARQVGPAGAEPPDTDDEFAADDGSPGPKRLGSVEIALERVDHGEAATFHWSVRNTSGAPIQLESAVLGLRWSGHGLRSHRFLRHGWQSWSFTGVRELDAAGDPPFPSGAWLRGMHHAVGAPPAGREGWHESDIVTVAGGSPDGPACLVGVLETGTAFGSVYLRRLGLGLGQGEALSIEAEVRLETVLGPGESRRLESVRVALGDDANRLLECFAELWGRTAGARTRAPFQAGWCSWYHFFHEVTEDHLLRNLDALAGARDAFPIDVIQLDDGYQRAIGDWLETNEKFPRGLAPLARDISDAGFRPGLWTAPFCVVPESQVYRDHPDWLLQNGDEHFRALAHPQWTPSVWVQGLDTSQDAVLRHLRQLFASLVEMGFTYLKLDFLHAVAMRADASDPRVSRAERLRRGLEAVREGAGEAAFLLGCGCPLGPAVGVVDGMRIGPDVAPSWEHASPAIIPGLEPVLPSTKNALRSILHRAWMHRRLWLNDPDCLMARSADTGLNADEIRSLAAVIGSTGGMLVFSDDVPGLTGADRACIGETLGLAREVDALASRGVARARGLLDPAGIEAVVASGMEDALVAVLNSAEAPAQRAVPLAAGAESQPLLGSPGLEAGASVTLGPHASAIYRLPGVRKLAVFCDFDGTFSVQDVGATLARQRAGERRPALWARYERGEITAWDYNMLLLNGLVVPEEELDTFLKTIELDIGAVALVRWCADRGVPFRILSDGFDRNLDGLQRIHGVAFEYDANRLRYEGDAWQIEAGFPNPECFCGTGTCKRGRIAAYRRAHPRAFCVHVGNGRVSDLCGAIEADLTFAKDTLAPALETRGIPYEPFANLTDVVSTLEPLWAQSGVA